MNYRDALIAEGVPPMTAQKFIIYHAMNPHVWRKFEEKANTLKAAGIQHYGAKAIFEVIRYEEMLQRGSDGFKANNSYAAYYARVYALKYGDSSFFETRDIKGLGEE